MWIFFYLYRQTTNENRAVGTIQSNIAYARFLGVPLHRCRLPNQRFGLHRTLEYPRTLRDNPHSFAIRRFSSVLHYFFRIPAGLFDILYSPFYLLLSKSRQTFSEYVKPTSLLRVLSVFCSRVRNRCHYL